MKFKIGDKVKYKNISFLVTGFFKQNKLSFFEASTKIENQDHVILFRSNGYVLPFSECTPNEETVQHEHN